MFLPHTDSFVLIRRSTVKPSLPVFSPYTDSFVFIRSPVAPSRVTPEAEEAESVVATILDPPDSTNSFDPAQDNSFDSAQDKSPQAEGEEPKVTDQSKRNFLKVAGVAGAGLIVSQLSPNKAHALIMGSSPTTGVVGVKDAANARINPATEETVSTLATEATAATLLKTSDLTFDTGSLQVKVTSLPAAGSSFSDSTGDAQSGLVDGDRHVQVDVLSSSLPASASTETTLQTIAFGGKKYALRLTTVGDIDYIGEANIGTATSSASWRVKKVDSTSGIIITWAGTGVFDQVWDNYATLTYS